MIAGTARVLDGEGFLGFILILTVVLFGAVVGGDAPLFTSVRTYEMLSERTAAEVEMSKTVGLRYMEVLLEILLLVAVGSDFGSERVQSC